LKETEDKLASNLVVQAQRYGLKIETLDISSLFISGISSSKIKLASLLPALKKLW
jgi:hypothetical protein